MGDQVEDTGRGKERDEWVVGKKRSEREGRGDKDDGLGGGEKGGQLFLLHPCLPSQILPWTLAMALVLLFCASLCASSDHCGRRGCIVTLDAFVG